MKRHSNTLSSRTAGFTLIEMAMVLVILSILLGGLMSALGQTTENTRRSKTSAQLRIIEEALYGFAQVNGRLPCPATQDSNGKEDPVTGGICTSNHGFVPSVTLGLYGSVNSDTLLLDAWKNPLRYSVSPAGFTSTAGMSSLFNSLSGSMLRICNTSNCSDTISADTVPAIVVSMGSNWATFTSNNEVKNAGETTTSNGYRLTTTNDFVSTEYSDENFDDMLIWLSPHVLFNRLIKAEQLP